MNHENLDNQGHPLPDPRETPDPRRYVVTTYQLTVDESISDGAYRLFGIISNLTNHHGYCWANNKYLGRLLHVNDRTISGRVSELKKAGWLISEEETGEYGTKRRLYLTENAKVGLAARLTPPRKKSEPPSQNFANPLAKNSDQNNLIEYSKLKKRDSPSLFEEKPLAAPPPFATTLHDYFNSCRADYEMPKLKMTDEYRKVYGWLEEQLYPIADFKALIAYRLQQYFEMGNLHYMKPITVFRKGKLKDAIEDAKAWWEANKNGKLYTLG